MRILVSAVLAASLFATNLLAGESVGPLAPGKAAGVKKAQEADHNLFWLAVGGAALTGLIIMSSEGGAAAASAAAAASSSSTSTSTTTASTTTSTAT